MTVEKEDMIEPFDQAIVNGKIPALKGVHDKYVICEDEDINAEHDNILIEGDNYHVLTMMNEEYQGRIDAIYIDPPYNTGAKDWRYNNDFSEKYDKNNPTYRHDRWLDFMKKRLLLAKKLLSPSGIIAISIDDYELYNLKRLMDEIFSEKCWLSTVPVIHHPGGRTDAKHFSTVHEYILFYAPNPDKAETGRFDLTEDDMKRFSHEDEFSRYSLYQYLRTGQNSDRTDRPNMFYPIYYYADTDTLSLEKSEGAVEFLPIDSDGTEKTWKWVRETFLKKKDTELITRTDANNTLKIFMKDRLFDIARKKPRSVWSSPRYSSPLHGTKLLGSIMGKKKTFPYPKSLWMIYDIIKVISKKDSIVLDFFAGSGTTGHAVLQLNRDDGGTRKFILCTSNENNICTDVCQPRLEKVMKGYTDPKGNVVEGFGHNLEYFKACFE